MKAPAKSDNTLWLSRVSFLVSAVALVSVGYRSISKRLQPETESTVATAAEQAPQAPLLMGLVHSTGLSRATLGFSHPSPQAGNEEQGATARLAISSKPRTSPGETFRASVKAQ